MKTGAGLPGVGRPPVWVKGGNALAGLDPVRQVERLGALFRKPGDLARAGLELRALLGRDRRARLDLLGDYVADKSREHGVQVDVSEFDRIGHHVTAASRLIRPRRARLSVTSPLQAAAGWLPNTARLSSRSTISLRRVISWFCIASGNSIVVGGERDRHADRDRAGADDKLSEIRDHRATAWAAPALRGLLGAFRGALALAPIVGIAAIEGARCATLTCA